MRIKHQRLFYVSQSAVQISFSVLGCSSQSIGATCIWRIADHTGIRLDEPVENGRILWRSRNAVRGRARFGLWITPSEMQRKEKQKESPRSV
jgi:hypothetical protein